MLDADGRGEVKHLVGSLDLLVDEIRIQDRALHDPDVIALQVREPARGEIVEDRHLGTFVAKRVDEMGTDEAGASSHEGAHPVRVRHRPTSPRHGSSGFRRPAQAPGLGRPGFGAEPRGYRADP